MSGKEVEAYILSSRRVLQAETFAVTLQTTQLQDTHKHTHTQQEEAAYLSGMMCVRIMDRNAFSYVHAHTTAQVSSVLEIHILTYTSIHLYSKCIFICLRGMRKYNTSPRNNRDATFVRIPVFHSHSTFSAPAYGEPPRAAYARALMFTLA